MAGTATERRRSRRVTSHQTSRCVKATVLLLLRWEIHANTHTHTGPAKLICSCMDAWPPSLSVKRPGSFRTVSLNAMSSAVMEKCSYCCNSRRRLDLICVCVCACVFACMSVRVRLLRAVKVLTAAGRDGM